MKNIKEFFYNVESFSKVAFKVTNNSGELYSSKNLNIKNTFAKAEIDVLGNDFKCGLNISESSKLLYIHRNTLIYRIDKLQKFTGFDIKNFNEAIVFKVLYSLWKEKKKIKKTLVIYYIIGV